jgi:hypothetical protein
MAVTNAISSIIILGALMQIGSGSWLVMLLAALSVFMAGSTSSVASSSPGACSPCSRSHKG